MNNQNVPGKILSLDAYRDYQYWLLPGNCPPDFPLIEMHNDAYNQWHSLWTQVFKQIANEKVRAEDFWRQQIICVLTKEMQIVALHLYSFFNLDSTAALAHSYFRINYKDEHIKNLRRDKISSVMSMEYFTVNPEYRRRTAGVPLSSLVLGLGFRVLKASGYDAAIGPCRRDLKVDERVIDFGGYSFSDEFIHHGVPVVNMVAPAAKMHDHPDPSITSAIERIWEKRKDYSNIDLTRKSETPAKKAA